MHILVLNGSPKAGSKMNEGMIAPYKKISINQNPCICG